MEYVGKVIIKNLNQLDRCFPREKDNKNYQQSYTHLFLFRKTWSSKTVRIKELLC